MEMTDVSSHHHHHHQDKIFFTCLFFVLMQMIVVIADVQCTTRRNTRLLEALETGIALVINRQCHHMTS